MPVIRQKSQGEGKRMSDVAPVQEQSRIKSLDVMRGFALLGILAVNAAFFAAPWQTSQNPLLPPLNVDDATLWSWFVMHVFFEFKCITLFSILFGASIYLVGGERSDKDRGRVLRRRLFWLLIFGLIHALLIWFGDILVTYALTGFLVLFARSWKAPTLLIVGTVIYVLTILPTALGILFASSMPPDVAEQMLASQMEMKPFVFAPSDADLAAMTEAFRGDIISVTSMNARLWSTFFVFAVVGLIVRTAAVMMIGMGLYKLGFLSGRSPVWVYVLFLLLGIAALSVIAYEAMQSWAEGYTFTRYISGGTLANTALSIFGSLGYAALFVLLLKAGLRFLTEPLAAVGRMAFTNYIMQSLIMTTIFWGGRGFGLYGEVDRPTLWAIVLGVWALQLIWSPLWLSRFEMGPLEWIWRRLSYAKPVRIAKPAAA
jgi:uncharacterized protein